MRYGYLEDALALGESGSLDLNGNDMIDDSGAQLGAVRTWIAGARNGGTWDGYGVTSTAARKNPARTTTLGYMTGADYKAIYGKNATFAGETVGNSAVVIRYALHGDADFNGGVNFNDFLRLQTGFGQTNATSAGGDFDYDGDVDFNDFLSLQTNFGLRI